jgi:hypothetical protein
MTTYNIETLNSDLYHLEQSLQASKERLVASVMLPLIASYQRVELNGVDSSSIRFTVYELNRPKYLQENLKEQYEALGFRVYTTSEATSDTRFKAYFDISVQAPEQV